MTGYTLEYIAHDLGVSKRRLFDWIAKGLLPGNGSRCGRSCRSSSTWMARARAVRDAYDHWPHGPAANIRVYVDRVLA